MMAATWSSVSELTSYATRQRGNRRLLVVVPLAYPARSGRPQGLPRGVWFDKVERTKMFAREAIRCLSSAITFCRSSPDTIRWGRFGDSDCAANSVPCATRYGYPDGRSVR